MDNKPDEFIIRLKFTHVQTSIILQLKRYLETISGVSPRLQPVEVSHLPLFLRNRYKFYSAELFGRPWCLAQEDTSWDPGSAGEYEKQAETLRPLLNAPVVFILPALLSNTRSRMSALPVRTRPKPPLQILAHVIQSECPLAQDPASPNDSSEGFRRVWQSSTRDHFEQISPAVPFPKV